MKVKNILVSQPIPAVIEKSPFYELIHKYGVKVEFFPFIKVEGITLREFRSQRVEILEHTAVIFNSRTTIDHFFRICDEARITIPESMKYLCNTEAVALYLQKYIVYRKRKIFFADGSFPNFMELILKHRDERMLMTLSEPYKMEMITAMEKLKLRFSRVVLSRAVSRDLSEVKPSAYDMMVFYSPAEITALAAAFPVESLPMIAAFGNTTTRTAIDAGIAIRAMAPTPQVPSMTKALDLFIAKVNAGENPAPVVIEQNTQVEEFVKAQEAKPVKKSRSKRTTSKPTAKTTASKANAAAKPNGAAKPAAKKSTTAKPAVKKPAAATASQKK